MERSGFLIPVASNISITPSEVVDMPRIYLIAVSTSSSDLPPVPSPSNFCNLAVVT